MPKENPNPAETPKNEVDGEVLEPAETVDGEPESEQQTEPESTEEKTPEQQESPESSALFGDDGAAAQKTPKKVSLTTFVCSCIALILAAVMLTYTLCNNAYQAKLAEAKQQQTQTGIPQTGELSYELAVLQKIFETYSFADMDEEQMRTAVLKAYVEATGDRYAEYYTQEEYDMIISDMDGGSQGIGVNIINATANINGVDYKVLKIVNVVKDSPAMKAGIKFGDCILAVGTTESGEYVEQLGYDMALKKLQGAEGTVAEFVVYREGEDAPIGFSIMREKFEASSVIFTKAEDAVGENIGVVRIVEFDKTTPTQLCYAIESLKNEGCDKFVFDLRYNLGGERSSIVATLSYFLDSGDTVMSTKDKAGNETVTTVEPVENPMGCSVKAEDIGKYKGLNMVVLCNESTASAAELFVANVRDHELGAIVGTKTYGKGSMQSYLDLSRFGCKGFLKVTAHMYFPPNGVGYDGEGIKPHHEVPLSEQAASLGIYETMGKTTDNQLVEAVKYFK